MIVSLLNKEVYVDLGWEEEFYYLYVWKLYDFLGVVLDSVEELLRERVEVGEGYWEKFDFEYLLFDDFIGV